MRGNSYEPSYITEVSLTLSCSLPGNGLAKHRRTGLISKKIGDTALDWADRIIE